ncbi:MAG: TM2 domain-containing protein [Fusobacteria bacterium]|nr:TM2 domain-containing protein [Fusobacteriota bacterium]
MDDKNNNVVDDSKLNPEYDETVAGKEGWKVAEPVAPVTEAPAASDIKPVEQPKGNPDYDESVAGKEGWKVAEPAAPAPEAESEEAVYDESVAGKEGWKVAEPVAPVTEAPAASDIKPVEQPKGNPDYDESVAGKEGWSVAEPAAPVPEAPKAEEVPVAPVEPVVVTAEADDSRKILAGVLGIVFAGFGIHNFLYGYTAKGIIQLVLSLVGIILSCLLIPILFWLGSVIWCVVESIMILTGHIKPAPKK